MKKIFTLIAALGLTMAASADTVWDFTVLPTQKIDGTGNLETNAADGVFVEDEGAAWQAFYNNDAIDGAEFTASAGTVLELTKGLKWNTTAGKQVYYRNYPESYGGKYIFFNANDIEIEVPAKAGQVIEIVASTAKNNKKITSQDVVETFEDGNGETLQGVVIDGTTNYDWKTYTLTVKTENPFLKFEKNACIQKIEVKDGTTGITSVSTHEVKDDAIYNLSGQRISAPVRGQIYIQNGKKYLAK